MSHRKLPFATKSKSVIPIADRFHPSDRYVCYLADTLERSFRTIEKSQVHRAAFNPTLRDSISQSRPINH